MNYTPQQKNAIFDRSGTLLLSAGAGSGKTYTLTKRIINRISDVNDPAEIDGFLVVTFTNAAAAELSERIEKALVECVSEDLSNKKAMRQLAKLKNANISTINSFCYSVVKRHFQALGLPPKLRISDESEAKLLKLRAINSVIDEKHAVSSKGDMFYNLVELFSSGRGDASLIDSICDLYTKMQGYPEPFEWLSNARKAYEEASSAADFFDTRFGAILKEEFLSSLSDALESLKNVYCILSSSEGFENYMQPVAEDIANVENVLCDVNDKRYNDVYCCISELSKSRLKAVRNVDENIKKRATHIREEAFKRIDSAKRMLGIPPESIRAAANDCILVIDELSDVIKKVDEYYTDAKLSRGIVDFSDVERYAYKLFVKSYDSSTDTLVRSEIAQEYAERFVEIYIDEYQDINPIQDIIFRSICRYGEGSEVNRFMVGDIKQSIYRFRGARPDLFKGYLDSFSKISDDGKIGAHKEFLSNNFRCSQSVVDFTNYIFSGIMSDSYSEDERLVYSKKEDYKVNSPCEILTFEASDSAENDYYDDEIVITAEKILAIVGNENILSSEGKPYTYGDITVLLRSTKNVAHRYAKYFELCGIPTYSEVTDNFFDNPEILLMLCVLNSIDNPFRDVYLTGLMRSEIFGFSDDELVSIRRLNKKITYSDRNMWQSVNDIAQSDIEDSSLRQKCADFVATLNDLRALSVGMSSDRILLEIYSRLHIFNVVSGKSFNVYSDSSELRRENLNILYNLARTFEKSSFRGLSAFIDFLGDKMQDAGSVNSAVKSGESGSVKIMSIHHSKGLEFPVCIISGLSKKFNTNDVNKGLIISDNLGLSFMLKDLEGFSSCDSTTGLVYYDTPFREAMRICEKKQLLEEEKRILYVAMTRARDRLVMIMKAPDESQLDRVAYMSLKQDFGASDAVSLSDYLLPAVYNLSDSPFVKITKVCADSSFSNISSSESKNEQKLAEAKVEEYRKMLDSILSESASQKIEIPTKVTVSRLKYGLLDEEPEYVSKPSLAVPSFVSQKDDNVGAKKGTAMHMFMQFADYRLAADDVSAEARRLLERGFITGEQFELLDYDKLSGFFKSGLYSEIMLSDNVMRERRFALNIPARELVAISSHLCRDDDLVLLQGVIDLFFENPDGSYTVVDFKTDKVYDETRLVEAHRAQLEYYKKAVELMTEGNVSKILLYSFELGKEISVIG